MFVMPSVSPIHWVTHPFQTYQKEKQKQVLYKKLETHTRDAVQLFKPKKPHHAQSIACDMKEWELWRDMRDVIDELDSIEKN